MENTHLYLNRKFGLRELVDFFGLKTIVLSFLLTDNNYDPSTNFTSKVIYGTQSSTTIICHNRVDIFFCLCDNRVYIFCLFWKFFDSSLFLIVFYMVLQLSSKYSLFDSHVKRRGKI